MKRLYRQCIYTIVALVALLSTVSTTWSAITIQDVSPTDVTPSGFAIIWQTSESAVPGISIFTDPDGVTEITNQLEIIPFPLYGGNPEIIGEYERDEDMVDIRSMSSSYGIMKIRVEGCLPETTYYYRISSEGAGGEIAVWPAGVLPSVTTTRENAFIADSKQVLVTIDDQGGVYNPLGWLVTAYTNDTLFGVSSFAGDGAAANQAYINLSNLFGQDGLNWTPGGIKEIILEIRRGMGNTTAYKTFILDFSNNFAVSSLYAILTEPDTDDDGIPDSWEMANFGDLTTVSDISDYDGDNSPDWYEYLAGSGPRDINSKPVDIDIVIHKGLNIFGYPVTESTGLNSYGLLALLGNSTDIERILVYDKTNNLYKETYYDGAAPAGANVDIGFGDGVMVYSSTEKTVSFNPAIRPFNSYIECASVDLAAGLNVVTFPCVPPGYTSYLMLADPDIGGAAFISSVQRFNPVTGEFETAGYVEGLRVGEDFIIREGEGYIINMIQSVPGFRP